MGIQPGFGGQPGRLAIKAKFFGNFASGDCLLQAALVNARNPKGPASLDIGKIRVAMPGRMSNGGDLVIKPVVRRAGAPTAITALAFTNPQGPARRRPGSTRTGRRATSRMAIWCSCR
jgi:hypothetical protein